METNVVRTTCPLIGNGQIERPAEDREERMRILLQLFASDPVDISQIVGNGVAIFKTADADGAEGGDNEEQETEGEDAEEVSDEPILFPRLMVTDQNLPQTGIGEMVVRDEDGNLLTVTVDKEGEVTEQPFMIGEDNIEDGSISASKLAEGSITAREVDLGDLFSDSSLLNQLIAANIDTDELFLNDLFVERFRAGSIEALTARINEIVAGSVAADTLYAAMADIITLRVAQAEAGTITTDELRAALATIADAQIGTANIDFAQIQDLVAGTAIITEGVGGKLYINRLAVTSANIVELTVGQLVIKGADGKYYHVSIDAQGQIVTTPVQKTGDNVAPGSIPNTALVEHSITTDELNAAQIFGDSAIIAQITSGIITTGQLFAQEAVIRAVRSNSIPRVVALPADPDVGHTVIYTGATPPEPLQWTGKGTKPTQRTYAAVKTGGAVKIEDIADDREVGVLVKTVAKQATGTPTLTSPLALTGYNKITIHQPKNRNLIPPLAEVKSSYGVTFTPRVSGSILVTGTSTNAINFALVGAWNSGVPLYWLKAGTYTLKQSSPDIDIRLVSNATTLARASAPTFTLVTDTPITAVFAAIDSGKTLNTWINFQIEEGTASTAYIKYDAIITEVTPLSTLWGMDGHEDRWGNGGGEQHYTGYTLLNGSESGWYESAGNAGANTKVFAVPLFATTPQASARTIYPGIRSNRMVDRGDGVWASGAYADTGSVCVLHAPANSASFNLYIRVPTSLAADLAAFKVWMASNTIQVVYRKETPDAGVQGDAIPVQGIGGVNIITSDGASVQVEYTGTGWERVANSIIGTNVEIRDDKFRVASPEVEFAIIGSDGEESISKIDEDGAYFPAMEAPDVAPRWPGPYSLTINPAAETDEGSGVYSSLDALAAALRYCYLGSPLTITLAGGAVLYGSAAFLGIVGAPITFTSDASNKATIVGQLYIGDTTSSIIVQNLKIRGPANINALGLNRTLNLAVYNCEISTSGTNNCIYIPVGGTLYAESTMLTGGARALFSDYASRVTMKNTKGSGFTSGAMHCRGGTLICSGTIPSGTITASDNGIVVTTGTVVDSGSGATGSTETTATYSAANSGCYKASWQTGSEMRQGYTGYEYTGCFWLSNSAVRAALAGKTIKDAKLTLRRKAGYGVSGAIKVRLRGTTATGKTGGQPDRPKNYGTIGSIKNGQTATFSIPVAAINDLVSGAINGFALYADDGEKLPGKAYSANYGVFYGGSGDDGPKIIVTY